MEDMVQFTDFEANASRARQAHKSSSPSFWPAEWMIVVEKESVSSSPGFINISSVNYPKWIRENCVAMVDFAYDDAGVRVFAFESDEDGILFKMSF